MLYITTKYRLHTASVLMSQSYSVNKMQDIIRDGMVATIILIYQTQYGTMQSFIIFIIIYYYYYYFCSFLSLPVSFIYKKIYTLYSSYWLRSFSDCWSFVISWRTVMNLAFIFIYYRSDRDAEESHHINVAQLRVYLNFVYCSIITNIKTSINTITTVKLPAALYTFNF